MDAKNVEYPAPLDSPTEIPVIDLATSDHSQVVHAIAKAAEEWGFFQVVNHGIPKEVIDELLRSGREFFEKVPQEEKEAIAVVPGSGSFEGYGSKKHKEMEEKDMEKQGRKAWVDFLFHNIWPPSKVNYQFWPKNPDSYRKAHEEYAKHLKGVMDEMLRCLSIGLGVDGHVLNDAVGGEEMEYLLKLNYYPPCPQPDSVFGVMAHTDMAAFTILLTNEVSGLQIFKDDNWFDVNYVPNAFVVNIGDQMEVLSNGRYRSVYHRTTVNEEKVRMSWAVFCAPPGDKVIGPLPELVSDEKPAKYKTKMFKDYQYCRTHNLPQ